MRGNGEKTIEPDVAFFLFILVIVNVDSVGLFHHVDDAVRVRLVLKDKGSGIPIFNRPDRYGDEAGHEFRRAVGKKGRRFKRLADGVSVRENLGIDKHVVSQKKEFVRHAQVDGPEAGKFMRKHGLIYFVY